MHLTLVLLARCRVLHYEHNNNCQHNHRDCSKMTRKEVRRKHDDNGIKHNGDDANDDNREWGNMSTRDNDDDRVCAATSR